MLRKFTTTLGLCTLTAFAVPAMAAGYPDRPVTLVVPYAAGGAADSFTRALADYLKRAHGVQAVVENRDGGSSIVATEYLKAAAPDGYTMMFLAAAGPLSYAFSGQELLIGRDIDTAGGFTETLTLWAVNPSVLDVSTPAEVIAYAKANPEISYASIGTGSTGHLTMLDYSLKQGLGMEHIAYRGGAPATTALVSGEVAFSFGTDLTSAMPHIKAGTLRPIAIPAARRFGGLPDVPAVTEVGLPELAMSSYGGIGLPHGTPKEVAETIQGWLEGAVQDAEFQERMTLLGTEVRFWTAEEFAKDLNENTKRFEKIITENGIKR